MKIAELREVFHNRISSFTQGILISCVLLLITGASLDVLFNSFFVGWIICFVLASFHYFIDFLVKKPHN